MITNFENSISIKQTLKKYISYHILVGVPLQKNVIWINVESFWDS